MCVEKTIENQSSRPHARPAILQPGIAREGTAKQEGGIMVSFTLNNRQVSVDADPKTPLLWVIRDHVGLTGTKYGCGAGLCGACTVHVDGTARTRLPDRCRLGRRQEGRHHRGPVAEFLASVAEGLGRRGSAAVRLLPVGPDHEGGRAAGEESQADPRRDRRRTWTATSAAAGPITASSPPSSAHRGRAEP